MKPDAHAQRLFYREGLCRDGCRGRNNYNSVGSWPGQWRVAKDTVLNVSASRALITVQRPVVAQSGIAELQSQPCAAGGHVAGGNQAPREYCHQQDPD